MKTNGALLKLEEVNKQFDGLLAIADVSLCLYSGEIVSLIGPNGAGKTTILNLISGVYPPTSGEIFLNGESIIQGHALLLRLLPTSIDVPLRLIHGR